MAKTTTKIDDAPPGDPNDDPNRIVNTLSLEPEVKAHVEQYADQIRSDLEKLIGTVRTNVLITVLNLFEIHTLSTHESFSLDKVSEKTGVTDQYKLERLIGAIRAVFKKNRIGTFICSDKFKPEGAIRPKAFYHLEYKEPTDKSVDIDSYSLPGPILPLDDEQIKLLMIGLKKIHDSFVDYGETTFKPFLMALMKAVEQGKAAPRSFIDLYSVDVSLAERTPVIMRGLEDLLAQYGFEIISNQSKTVHQPVLTSMLEDIDYQEVMPQSVLKFFEVIDRYLNEGKTPSYLLNIVNDEEVGADGEANYQSADFNFDFEHFKKVYEDAISLPLKNRRYFPHKAVIKMITLYSLLGRQISKKRLVELAQTIDPNVNEAAVNRAIKQITGFLSRNLEIKTALHPTEEGDFFYFEAGEKLMDIVTSTEVYEFKNPPAIGSRGGLSHDINGRRVRRLMTNSALHTPFSIKLRPRHGEVLVVLDDNPDPDHEPGEDDIKKAPFDHLNLIEE